MPLASHVELPERYRVARHIASGGMASVWEVEDLLLGRIVAVKVLGAHYAADPGARARFQREARMAARVSDHPNIATIYDIGEHANDAFIVMEYFAGGTVANRLRTARERGERVSPTTALRWLHEAAAALDVAHAAGIVHRDVKPANLLLDAHGRLAVGDFGIARLADDTPVTQTGQVLGTAAYLSPEQALGRSASAASDRYALAVVAYELLTGQRPFEGGPPAAQLRQHAEAPPPRASKAAPELPAAVDRMLARGLAKDPDDRPSTAITLVDDIKLALISPERTVHRTVPLVPLKPHTPTHQRAAAAPPPPPRDPVPAEAAEPAPASAGPRRPSPIPLLGFAALLAGVIVALALTSSSPDEPRRSAGDGPAATQTTRTRASATPKPESSRQKQQQQRQQQPTQTSPPAQAASASSSSPFELNAKGDALNDAGRYGEAVEPLQASVQGYRGAGKTKDINYAYALYNLGVALNRSGNPAVAIEVLSERLKYDDGQLPTVRAELANARARLGRAGEKPGTSDGSGAGSRNRGEQ